MTVSDALNSAAAYRLALLAALDELHAAALRERRLREQLAEQRDAWARLSTERLVSGA